MGLPLNHPPSYELLLGLDGDVTDDHAKSILDHLFRCPQCRTSVEEIEGMLSMFAEAQNAHGSPAPPSTAVPIYLDQYSVSRRAAPPQIDDSELQRTKEKLKRRLRDLYQHRPRVLLIVVNGRPTADLAIVHRTNSWTLEVGSRVDYIEVISDRGIRLLALYVEEFPMFGFTELEQVTRLSGGRDLQLMLSQKLRVI